VTQVVVLGATGEMGERAARLIQRWVPSARVVGANRSGRGHPDFPVRAVDVADEAALRSLLQEALLCVNAVGPYRWDPAPLVRACVAERCHYVDLAEDLGFLGRVVAAARVAGAQQAQVSFVPGASTVPGLVQLLSTRWAERSDVVAVSAFLSLGSANPVSRGLLAGLIQPLGRPLPRGPGKAFGSLAPARTSDGQSLLVAPYPAPWPAHGMRIGSRHVAARFYVGFDRAWMTRLLHRAAPLLGLVPEQRVASLAPLLLPFVRALRPLGTPRGVLVVVAGDAEGRELDRVEVHAEANGLDIPAAPPVWVAAKLAAGSFPPSGVASLGNAVDPAEAIAWLERAGYAVLGGASAAVTPPRREPAG